MVKVIYKVVRHFYRRIFHHFANSSEHSPRNYAQGVLILEARTATTPLFLSHCLGE